MRPVHSLHLAYLMLNSWFDNKVRVKCKYVEGELTLIFFLFKWFQNKKSFVIFEFTQSN